MENQTGNFNIQDRPRIRETYGEILGNGVIIELVTAASGNKVTLLRWDGQNYEIGQQFQDGSTIYCPPNLHSSLFAATWFARGPAEYGKPLGLFWKVVDLFCRYMGFSRGLAVFMTGCILLVVSRLLRASNRVVYNRGHGPSHEAVPVASRPVPSRPPGGRAQP